MATWNTRSKHAKGKGKAGRRTVKEETPSSDEGEATDHSSSDVEEQFVQSPSTEREEPCDELYGCTGCQWQNEGCKNCRLDSPVMKRLKCARWKAGLGRPQEVPSALNSVRFSTVWGPNALIF